jgi:hypothetical protein
MIRPLALAAAMLAAAVPAAEAMLPGAPPVSRVTFETTTHPWLSLETFAAGETYTAQLDGQPVALQCNPAGCIADLGDQAEGEHALHVERSNPLWTWDVRFTLGDAVIATSPAPVLPPVEVAAEVPVEVAAPGTPDATPETADPAVAPVEVPVEVAPELDAPLEAAPATPVAGWCVAVCAA